MLGKFARFQKFNKSKFAMLKKLRTLKQKVTKQTKSLGVSVGESLHQDLVQIIEEQDNA